MSEQRRGELLHNRVLSASFIMKSEMLAIASAKDKPFYNLHSVIVAASISLNMCIVSVYALG